MIKKYDHKSIEKKWQKYWETKKIWEPKEDKDAPKSYILDMFPYPSAEGLHVGHPEGYTASDIMARYLRLKGKNVLHPMGFDSFGLPAENYAIKTGTHPATTTAKNIKNMRQQIKALGFSYDWSREVITSDPKYYKWTQWIFIQLFKHGLAYEADAPINWCPSCKTGLANEEVVNGKCERCGTGVSKKQIKQWLVKITDEKYIERLLNDLDDLDWPESIKHLQRNWIGRSEGVEVDFEIDQDIEKVILMHGKDTDPTKKWYPWFREQVKKQGKKIIAPSLPEASDPRLEEWLSEIDKTMPDEKSILIGHSRGGVAILRWLERLPKGKRIKRVILIGTNAATSNKSSKGFFGKEFDFKKIKSHCNDFVVFHSRDDNWVPFDAGVHNAKGLNARTFFPNDRAHFGKLTPTISELIDVVFTKIRVFTTRPDTLFGATYIVLSPEHELVDKITTDKQHKEVHAYQKKAAGKSDLERTDLAKDKTGVDTGAKAINPATGKPIPIWIADYVLSSYGTGAIMAVPAHDERDWEFAKKFDLEIIKVVKEIAASPSAPRNDGAFVGEGEAINSGEFNGLKTDEFKKKITEWLEKNKVGKKAVNYKLRDWLFSRQRYWGEPIPIVHCESCKNKIKSTPHYLNFRTKSIWDRLISGEKEIESRALNPEEPERYFGNIKNGDVIKCVNKNNNEHVFFEVTKIWKFKNIADLFKHQDVVTSIKGKSFPSEKDLIASYETLRPGYTKKIEIDGLIAWKLRRVYPGLIPVPEKDLPLELPDIKKYEPTGTGESPLAAIDKWVNTKCPKCGGKAKRETNTMPQWAGSNWYWLRYCDPHNDKMLADPEKLKQWLPVDLYIGGAEHAVLHLLYARFIYKFLFDIGAVPKKIGDEPFKKLKNQGLIMGEDGVKMSKSRGNVVNPDDVIKEYGADTMRMYEMFMGPFEDSKPWDTKGIIGIKRFLDRVWNVVNSHVIAYKNGKLKIKDSKLIHKTIKKVSEDIEGFKFNTAISAMMEWFNERDWGMKLNKQGILERKEFDFEAVKKFIIILSPFAPHMTEELWEMLGHKKSISKEKWPEYNEKLIKRDKVTIVVQVNGKLRDNILVPVEMSEDEVKKVAQARDKIKKYLTTEPKKVIFVPGKLINFVV